MAIYFLCGCGQDLRCDEDRAGGRVQCPACGHLVPVPSLQAANDRIGIKSFPLLELATPAADPDAGRGVLPAGLPPVPTADVPARRRALPAERLEPGPPLAPAPVDDPEEVLYRLAAQSEGASANPVQEEVQRGQVDHWLRQARDDIAVRRRAARPWQRERYWFQSLLYPLLAWPLVFGLALAWFILSLVFLNLLPAADEPATLLAALPLVVVPAGVFAYTAAFFRCVLVSGMRGEAGFVSWPGADWLQIAWSGLAALVCFLAGPVVPVAAAFYFWLNSGELEAVDWLILWELGTLAVLPWLLGLVAILERNRLRDALAGPALAVRRRGWRVAAVALAGSAVAAGIAVLALRGTEVLESGGGAWSALAYFWAGELFWMVFLLRWLGLLCFRARQKAARPRRAAPACPEHTSLA